MKMPVHPVSRFAGVALAALLVLGWSLTAPAQGSKADYERAANLSRQFSGKVFRDRVEAHWLAGNTSFWYEVKTGTNSHEFVFVDAVKGERRAAFDHAKLATALAKTGMKATADNLPITNLEWNAPTEITFRTGGKNWHADLTTYTLSENTDSKVARANSFSADEAPHVSRDAGADTSLTFINRTPGDVELFWLDEAGDTHSYGKLAANARREQHTFAGHVWLAMIGGHVVAAFEGTDKPGLAEITNTLTVAAAPRGRGNRGGGPSPFQAPRPVAASGVRFDA